LEGHDDAPGVEERGMLEMTRDSSSGGFVFVVGEPGGLAVGDSEVWEKGRRNHDNQEDDELDGVCGCVAGWDADDAAAGMVG